MLNHAGYRAEGYCKVVSIGVLNEALRILEHVCGEPTCDVIVGDHIVVIVMKCGDALIRLEHNYYWESSSIKVLIADGTLSDWFQLDLLHLKHGDFSGFGVFFSNFSFTDVDKQFETSVGSNYIGVAIIELQYDNIEGICDFS
ncbi:hypothetical protein AMTR_s00056p00191540 [Amborella trichopoda]|uniref:Uncharacterized protein n=1 Tax=Amborella trichopoda TaxID=13333 RepID=U5CYI2_AMBTC|nr:hypothetical protein AMTR_s00056p00191540 [Amborella trichopoda]